MVTFEAKTHQLEYLLLYSRKCIICPRAYFTIQTQSRAKLSHFSQARAISPCCTARHRLCMRD